jgi:hypothetical protein
VAAHLQESAIVGTLTANEDRLHRGLHVVVDAADTGALKETECSIMRVEHHLLRLARVGARKQHPAVAQPDMCHLHRYRRAVDQYDLVAPVELIRLARGETERNERTNRGCRAVPLPGPGITPHSIIAAFVTDTA